MIGSIYLIIATLFLSDWMVKLINFEPAAAIEGIVFMIMGMIQFSRGFHRKYIIIITTVVVLAVITMLGFIYL